MKHLFLVHSHITDLVAQQVVIQKKLPSTEVVFLLSRKHQSAFPCQVEFPYTHYPQDSFGVSFLFWKNRLRVENLDEWLDELSKGEDFIFYTPQSGMNYFYLITSHVNCKGFAYIEEGLGSYKTFKEIASKKKPFWLRDRWYDLNFKNRAPSIKHFFDLRHKKYLGCFAISKHAFPDLEHKTVLKLPFKKQKFKEDYQHLIVLGPYVEYGEVGQAVFLASFRDLLDWMVKNKIQNAHIKHHPAQDNEQSIAPIDEILKSYQDQISVITMGAEVVLENIAINTSAQFYIVLGSIGIYADIAGNQVFSFAHKIVEKDPSFQRFLDPLPVFFKEKIKFI